MTLHKEIHFEAEICAHLAAHGWLYAEKDAADYDRARALFPADVIAWVQVSQPKAWEALVKGHGAQAGETFLARLRAQLDQLGTLHVLRQGVELLGLKAPVKLAELKPALGLNEEILARYHANRLRVVRQVRYSLHHENCIDLVLFLNGVPVATAGLKSDFTQSVGDAVDQYRFDRLPRSKGQSPEPLLSFPGGALVHFAVSQSEVHMTFKLAGPDTVFFPVNRAGKGNPLDPAGPRTPYPWEEIWARERWLEILAALIGPPASGTPPPRRRLTRTELAEHILVQRRGQPIPPAPDPARRSAGATRSEWLDQVAYGARLHLLSALEAQAAEPPYPGEVGRSVEGLLEGLLVALGDSPRAAQAQGLMVQRITRANAHVGQAIRELFDVVRKCDRILRHEKNRAHLGAVRLASRAKVWATELEEIQASCASFLGELNSGDHLRKVIVVGGRGGTPPIHRWFVIECFHAGVGPAEAAMIEFLAARASPSRPPTPRWTWAERPEDATKRWEEAFVSNLSVYIDSFDRDPAPTDRGPPATPSPADSGAPPRGSRRQRRPR